MNILTVEKITKAYGERKLFDEASFYMQEGEKVGVIGINGTGKSTLLRMIAGLEDEDSGSIVKASGMVVRFLPQNPEFSPEDTILEAVLRDNKDTGKGHNPEVEAKAMLTKLGVTDFERKCQGLSGGECKRLALVSVLLSPAELLILDEPTNHLDHEMADWLEEQLKKRRGAMIMVTHDRYFLDSVTNRIIEIDKGKIYSYESNYSGYLELKTQREEMALASERKRQSILRVELEWMQRGARARSTKQKAHIQRYEALRDMAAPVQDKKVELGSVASRLGKTTVELEHISKAFGDRKLIDDFSYIFLKDDRIGILGPNGCGKSTLMKMIMGIETPDAGQITIGQTVKIGYYAQMIGEDMNPNQKVIDYVKDVAEYIETEEGKITASRMLERFLFEGEDQYGLIGKLSGGERRRLNLLRVLMGNPNVLILDEPTNDLDISTLTILEDYLDHFQGIVIVVSHDRYFMDRVVRRIFAFEEGGKLRQFEGGYTDYSASILMEEMGLADTAGKSSAKSGVATDASPTGGKQTGANWKEGQQKKLKFTYAEQKEYESIEGDIAGLEAKIEQLEKDILSNARDFVKLAALQKEKDEAESLLEQKMDRWMYLEDLAARIEAGEMV
ncbi:MAG: ABC-F family ATP-binding cassette domain-containing protein [Lachnospiraceae bacterium]|nr:ABC-F family ATP-binding cassette domain-containing protein [Lachnospiraceae bacterium]